MHLSVMKDLIHDIDILTDGEFSELGLTATKSKENSLLCFIEKSEYLPEFRENSSIACVITTLELAKSSILNERKCGVAISENPRLSFFRIHNYLFESTNFYGDKYSSVVHPSSRVHPSAVIDPYNVEIGENVFIGPNTVINSNVKIGENSKIGSNCVIGGEGYECFRYDDVVFVVRSAGGVLIENNVEIHNATCIDKGIFGNVTRIGEYSQLDNLIHIAHDVQLGRRVFVVAGAMIAGRVVVDDDAWVGPSSSIRNGCYVGHNGFVSMGAVATRNVEPNQIVSGNFAIEHSKFIEFIKSIR